MSSALTPEDQARVVALALDLARQGETAQLLEFFGHGLPVDITDADGNSALMLAAYHGRADTVAALIARGVDLELRNARDQSVLAGAIFKGEDEVARLLIEAGADLDAGTPSARVAAEMFGRQSLLED